MKHTHAVFLMLFVASITGLGCSGLRAPETDKDIYQPAAQVAVSSTQIAAVPPPPVCPCAHCPTGCPVCPDKPIGGDGNLLDAVVNNYYLLFNEENHLYFGLTGLMAVVSFESDCYGTVRPGDSFLFPGGSISRRWNGVKPTIDCKQRMPLNLWKGGPTLHRQLADKICQKGRYCSGVGDFVGFSMAWKDWGGRTIGHNSGSANEKWFCQRALGSCCGVDWASLVDKMLLGKLTNRYYLLPNQFIRSALDGFPNQALKSQDGGLSATQQGDGNFVIYGPSGECVWASNTAGKGSPPYQAIMQGDGNFVVYGGSEVVFASDTQGNPGASIWLQNDRNLVIYRNGEALWASQDQPNGCN